MEEKQNISRCVLRGVTSPRFEPGSSSATCVPAGVGGYAASASGVAKCSNDSSSASEHTCEKSVDEMRQRERGGVARAASAAASTVAALTTTS